LRLRVVSQAGSVALWITAAVMGLSTLWFFFQTWRQERKYV
jgi:hypothetical protein